MKKILLFLLILLIPVSCVFAEEYDRCTQLLNDQKYPMAVRCYAPFYRTNRTNFHFRLVYGLALCQNRQYAAANEHFNFLIKRLPPGGYADYAKKYKQYCAAKRNQEKIRTKANKQDEYISDMNTIAVWNKKTVNYWVENGKYYYTVMEAFREWERETSYAVNFRKVNRPQYADIKVYFVDKLPQNILGVTTNRKGYANGKIVLKSSKIRILDKAPSGEFRSKQQIYPVILHEIGHAIGLEGHSNNKNDILYHNTDYYKQSLSDRDVETIKTIYGR